MLSDTILFPQPSIPWLLLSVWQTPLFFKRTYIYLLVFVCAGCSWLCAGYSLVAACGLLFVVASLVGTSSREWWASGAQPHSGSAAVARGIFPDRGWNLFPLHWQVDLNHRTTREVLVNSYSLQDPVEWLYSHSFPLTFSLGEVLLPIWYST